MKCTQCGCKKFIKLKGLGGLLYTGDSYVGKGESTSIYVCFECGHFEFFNSSSVEEYKYCERLVNELPREIEELRAQLAALEDPNLIPGIEAEIKQAEQQLRSLDITIRQQGELKEKVRNLRRRIENMPRQIRDLKDKISCLESQLKNERERLAGFEIIEE